MCSHDAQRRDVPMLYSVCWLLLHLCKDVADNLWRIVRRLFRPGYLMTRQTFGEVYMMSGQPLTSTAT